MGFSKDCAALDVNLGCSGYVYGLWLAHTMIASGGCERVLLLAGDTISRLVHEKDRSVAPLFGDGGSATLVEKSESAGVAHFSLQTDGSGFDSLIVPAGGARCPRSEETIRVVEDQAGNLRSPENLFMDGAEIFNFSITEEPRSVTDLLEYAGLGSDDVDHFVFHQANRYILTNIAKRLKLDAAKVPMQTVERYGNQSSASIPSAICGELANELKSGSSKKLLLSGFGVGLSWASMVADLAGLDVCELIDYTS
jgi:3-oxoacyl-[acyl-carrier-protein] synthase-3